MTRLVVFPIFFMVFFSGCFNFLRKKESLKPNKPNRLSIGETEEKMVVDWTNIPSTISESVLGRLTRTDFYRFGEVCTSWRHAVIETIRYRSSTPLPSMPLLLVYQPHICNDIKAGFCSLIDSKMHFPMTPLFKGKVHCLGSINGWLIMVDTLLSDETGTSSIVADHQFPSFFFWNPISNDHVMLPSQLTILYPQKWYKLFSKVKATSGPESPDCMVVGLFAAQHHIAFCRIHDESWSIITIEYDPSNIIFSDIEILHGKCYALTETLRNRNVTSILVYDLQGPNPLQAKILIDLQQQLQHSPSLKNLIFKNPILYYLASDSTSGDLYLVFIIVNRNVFLPPRGRSSHLKYPSHAEEEEEFIVYKVDMSDVHQLVKVSSLNGGILFLSQRDSKIVPSSTLNGPEDLIRNNTIYFAHAYRNKGNPHSAPQIAKFSMTDGRINHIPLPNPELYLESICLWFMPTLW